jgi:hypothetical protein
LSRLRLVLSATAGAWLAGAALGTSGVTLNVVGTGAESYGAKLSCASARLMCTEVQDPATAFGYGAKYVGHDEPSTLFYSNVPGSGNRMQYNLTIPVQPPVGAINSSANSYDFQLHPAFWFGMAMCDNFSYPETKKTCTPNSDSNIVNPLKEDDGPGVAFQELQFYPPGWIPQFAGSSCDPTKWCIALNIDSLSENPFTGQTINPTCRNQLLGGTEYINFAFLTLNGAPLGPPNPLQFNASTSGFPQNPNTFFLNPGDKATVNLHDSPSGLVTTVHDITTGQTGFMVASAANHFGHIVYAPTGTSCTEVDYNFHPMYSTSSPQTRVLWAAHTYNVAFSDEIGHFDFCSHIDANSPVAACNGTEGTSVDPEPADSTDIFCFSSEESLLYPVTGCTNTDAPGFDGPEYQTNRWPDSTSLSAPSTKPTPINFSAPLTGADYDTKYKQFAFENDLPRIEAADLGGSCVRSGPTIGAGCTTLPPSDDGTPVTFYPYFTRLNNCTFVEGANFGTGDSFGGSAPAEFGPANPRIYWVVGGGGATHPVLNTYNSGPIALTEDCDDSGG